MADQETPGISTAPETSVGASESEVRRALGDAAPAVRRYLFGMCGDWDLADDLAQGALLKAWRRRASFDGRAKLTTWVFAIARNHWLDELRGRRTRQREQTMPEDATTAAPHPGPHATAALGELRRAITAAMEKLPVEQREALALRESEGLKFREIADLLDVPVATVKSRVRYALLQARRRTRTVSFGAGIMNCEQARERLIDLVYDELDSRQRRDVREHLATCDACSEELAKLRAARAALAAQRGGEPAGPVALPQQARARRTLPLRRIGGIAAAAAAVFVAAAAVWMLATGTSLHVMAAEGPVEIRRQGVSVTILSRPENFGEFHYPQGQQVRQSVQPPPRGGNWSPWAQRRWPGLALIRDRRVIHNLPAGRTRVKFTDVPTGILPDSVRLRSLGAGGLTILEQNYQYDLASAEAVLRKYIDKKVTVHFKEDDPAGGVLLSFDERTLVIRPKGEGPRNVAREQVRAVSFAKLPEGLLSRPTLLWRLQNNAAARQQFEVAYMTYGLNWRADYVLRLRPAEGPRPAGEIMDIADLVGYATITNHSGVTYDDAELKLMAGDVNLIVPEGGGYPPPISSPRPGNNAADTWGFQEKSFFEYHLYTLGRPATIRSNETKQIELVSGSGLKLKRGYVYDPSVFATAPRVVSELENKEANGLGKPLPKGVVRLYVPGPGGVQTYVSQAEIDHTPRNEKLRFYWGYAFDIACSQERTGYRRRAETDHREEYEYSLRNHKDYDVTIAIVVRVPKTTYEASCTKDGKDYPWHVREVGWVEIDVPVKARSAETVKFSYSYNTQTGGGLRSPHDSKR